MATLGLSKVFILDKYFTELQKFWETEKKLQGMSNRKTITGTKCAWDKSKTFYNLFTSRPVIFYYLTSRGRSIYKEKLVHMLMVGNGENSRNRENAQRSEIKVERDETKEIGAREIILRFSGSTQELACVYLPAAFCHLFTYGI